MKKLISLFLCLCMVVSMIPAALAVEGHNYLALGDSITAGTGLNGGEASFPQIIAQRNGYTLNNQGVNGLTAYGIYATLASGALDEALVDTDLVTLTCGGNDLLALLYGEIARTYNEQYTPAIEATDVVPILANSSDSRYFSLLLVAMQVMQGNAAAGILPFTQREEFSAAIGQFTYTLSLITGYILAKNPNATVIVATQYNPYRFFNNEYQVMATALDNAAQMLNASIKGNAASGGYLVADVYSAFQATSENLCNATMSPLNLDFHPNAAGHAVMAQAFQNVIDNPPAQAPVVPEIPEVTEPVNPEIPPVVDMPVIDVPAEGEMFTGIGEYLFGNMPCLNELGITEYAAWIGVFVLEQSQEQIDALRAAFEAKYGFAPTAEVVCRYIGKFAVEGCEGLQDVYHYTITDSTYTLITSKMYELVTKVAENGETLVGFYVYGIESIEELMADPRAQEMAVECLELLMKLTGMTLDQIQACMANFDLSQLKVCVEGLVRTLEDCELVEALYVYISDTLLDKILGCLQPEVPEIPEVEEPATSPFTDVKPGDYFYESVLWAVENGITVGATATTFEPYAGCTRAQIVTFLWRAAGMPASRTGHNPFKDVCPTDYYYDAVIWAAEMGITVGTSADTFEPNAYATRAQVAAFLWRSAGKPAVQGNGTVFTDVDMDAYYAPAVMWAAENQITFGTGNGCYEPDATCSRAQIITLLYRILNP